jgi:diguanylate cyclase (GGDEF)-like protein/PAS domain S-box-containing protein
MPVHAHQPVRRSRHSLQQRIAPLSGRPRRQIFAVAHGGEPAMSAPFSTVPIDAFPGHIAIVDVAGYILAVNKAWREHALASGLDPAQVSEGANYLAACRAAAATGNADALRAVELITAVAEGRSDSASMEYSGGSSMDKNWFECKVTRVVEGDTVRILIAHEDISERKRAEWRIQFQAHLLASVEQAVIATDLGGKIIYWNRFAEKLYGWPAEEALGRDILDVTPTEISREQGAQIMGQLKMGKSWSGEFLVQHRDGTRFVMHVTDSPIRDENNELIGIIGISTDISEWKKVESALELAGLVYQALGEAIMVTDDNNRLVAANPAFLQLTGYAEHEIVGLPLDAVLAGENGDDFHDEMRHLLQKTGHWQGRIWCTGKEGKPRLQWLTLDTVYRRHGSVQNRVGMLSPVTDQKLAEETIWRQANFDLLTGLPNRTMFYDRLEYEIKKSSRARLPLALMFIDLDHFKEVNDALGHDAGDLLLREAACRLNSCTRRADTVARLGGDEFTVIMGELEDRESVERVAREILARLAEPFRRETGDIYVSASIGITLYPEDATSIEALLKNADQAMYAAKGKGRNRYNYFTPSMQRAAQARMQLVQDLHGAIEGGQFELMYQPIVALATGRMQKAEALLRWRHPVRGQIVPSEFISVAEETGIIVPIGEWVIEQAVRQTRHWRATADPGFQLSVNVSPVELSRQCINHSERGKHGGWLAAQQTMEMPGAIIMEITENVLLQASDAMTETLLLLRGQGLQIAIDDFGVGYSSLSYLRKFRADYLKIDQSFVIRMKSQSDDFALCEAMIVMGHKLGMKVIAEGIETREQRDLLTAAGCDYGQGFLFSYPVSATAMDALLKAGR